MFKPVAFIISTEIGLKKSNSVYSVWNSAQQRTDGDPAKQMEGGEGVVGKHRAFP